jgi:spoIIIJ-associated protein
MERTAEIKKIIEELLEKIGVNGTIEEIDSGDGMFFQIRTNDSGVLIGENGQNLFALYYITRRILERRYPTEEFRFSLDVNDYQRKKIEEIKERARMGAQRVRYFKKEVILQPMSAYERRIIHMTLAEDPDIITESRGEGENRSVVIKPAQN